MEEIPRLFSFRPLTKVAKMRTALQKFFTEDKTAKLYLYKRTWINKENFSKGNPIGSNSFSLCFAIWRGA